MAKHNQSPTGRDRGASKRLFGGLVVLIGLPFAVLSIAALTSVKADRRETEQTLNRQALVAAKNFRELRLAPALKERLAPADDAPSGASPWLFTFDSEGRLLDPPPLKSPPWPRRDQAAPLSVEQDARWAELQSLTNDRSAGCDRVADALEAWLQSEPPPALAARALSRAAARLAKDCPDRDLTEWRRQLAARFPDQQTAAGLPYAFVGAASQLRAAAAATPEAVSWIVAAARRLRNQPLPLTEELLTRLRDQAAARAERDSAWAGARDSLDRVRAGFLRDQTRRALHAAMTAAENEPPIVLFRGESYLVWKRPITAAAAPKAASAMAAMLHSDFRSVVSKAARRFEEDNPDMAVDATLAGLAAPSTDDAQRATLLWSRPGFPELRVSAGYADDARQLESHMRRSRRAVALVAASLASVIAGLWAVSRAFARQAELSQMKSNFVASVSHELRAPIASISLMAEELAAPQAASQPEAAARYPRVIQQETRRLAGLIDNVLDLSRIERGLKSYEFEPTDLRHVVETAATTIAPFAQARQIRLETRSPRNGLELEVDGHALQRATLNLLDNAIKFSPPNETVWLELQNQTDIARIEVRDAGPGVPQGQREAIFDPFRRLGSELRREHAGVGLGLAIVRHIAQAHGGAAFAASGGASGACFRIEIPKVRAHA